MCRYTIIVMCGMLIGGSARGADAPTTAGSETDVGEAAIAEEFAQLAHLTLARRAITLGVWHVANALFKAAARLNPNEQRFWRMVAEAALQDRDEETALTALEAAPIDEPSAVFLRPGLRPLDVLLDDLRMLAGWRARLTLLKEHLFPSAAYLRRTYASGSSSGKSLRRFSSRVSFSQFRSFESRSPIPQRCRRCSSALCSSPRPRHRSAS